MWQLHWLCKLEKHNGFVKLPLKQCNAEGGGLEGRLRSKYISPLIGGRQEKECVFKGIDRVRRCLSYMPPSTGCAWQGTPLGFLCQLVFHALLVQACKGREPQRRSPPPWRRVKFQTSAALTWRVGGGDGGVVAVRSGSIHVAIAVCSTGQ